MSFVLQQPLLSHCPPSRAVFFGLAGAAAKCETVQGDRKGVPRRWGCESLGRRELSSTDAGQSSVQIQDSALLWGTPWAAFFLSKSSNKRHPAQDFQEDLHISNQLVTDGRNPFRECGNLKTGT